MPFPLEAIYPLGIVAAALAAGGLALDYTSRFFNHGKVRGTGKCASLTHPLALRHYSPVE